MKAPEKDYTVRIKPLTGALSSPKHLTNRYHIGALVEQGTPVYVRADYWGEQISLLPNPPAVVGKNGFGDYRDTPARILWWDGDTDIVLIQYDAITGTGHSGVYDSMDTPCYFDASREQVKGAWGCVFIPTSAIDFSRLPAGLTGAIAEPEVLVQYRAALRWPTAPMIANFAQYRMQARVMGETLGVTRQAIHLAMKKMPATIREMTGVLDVSGERYLAYRQRIKDQLQEQWEAKWNKTNVPYGEIHFRAVRRYAHGRLDDFLDVATGTPALVDQTEDV